MSIKLLSGINIQWPISQLILSGKKTIETRTYAIPKKYLNKEIFFIETPGKKGKFKSRIVALIKFTKCIEYQNKEEFYKDSNKHFVTSESEWAWKDKKKFAWHVTVVNVFETPIEAPLNKGIVFTNNIRI